MRSFAGTWLLAMAAPLLLPIHASAQTAEPAQHDHAAMPTSTWHRMQEGVICFNLSYGSSPVSFQVFFRVRPPAPMGRMMDR